MSASTKATLRPTSWTLSLDGQTLTVRVPLAIKRRPGQTTTLSAKTETAALLPDQGVSDALRQFLVKAFLWQKWLDEYRFSSIRELAQHVGHNPSYVAKLLGFTLLAPDILEAILNHQEPPQCSFTRILRGVPAKWTDQRCVLGFTPEDQTAPTP